MQNLRKQIDSESETENKVEGDSSDYYGSQESEDEEEEMEEEIE